MNASWDFIPWHAAAGGLVIGGEVTLLLLFNGRIAGISGIVDGLYRMQKDDMSWRIAFSAGLMLSAVIWQFFFVLPEIQIRTHYALLVLAGLLVGYGTRLGSGCTSGHGVCGLSPFSPRSLVATVIFMVTGFITVYMVRLCSSFSFVPKPATTRLASSPAIARARQSSCLNSPRLRSVNFSRHEHRVFVQAIVWGLNSFDQPGVQWVRNSPPASSLCCKALRPARAMRPRKACCVTSLNPNLPDLP